ncbi:MAG: glycosyltransferase family 4 protein [Candidatus Micrarchaeia archaeon]
MRIAFFNWRDIKNPLAGGSEVFTHRLLSQLASRGHKVTLFCSTFKGCSRREVIDSIEHVRYSGRYLMFPSAYLCYKKNIEGKFDVIIESINGVPFFTPLFAREKVFAFIHQLTRENWYSGLIFPLAFLGYHSEDSMLSLYRKIPTMVPSESTRSDLESLGFRDLAVIPEAADLAPADDEAALSKEGSPTVLYLGRLTRSKRVDHAIRAFARIKAELPEARLWVAGSGPESAGLRSLAGSLGVTDSIHFFGRVDAREKRELLTKAHLLIFPAVREGWGLVVLEANACGTPVVAYDVPGLRDSIRNGINGYLVKDGDIAALSAESLHLLKGGKALSRLSASSIGYSRGFTWERSADAFMGFVSKRSGR